MSLFTCMPVWCMHVQADGWSTHILRCRSPGIQGVLCCYSLGAFCGAVCLVCMFDGGGDIIGVMNSSDACTMDRVGNCLSDSSTHPSLLVHVRLVYHCSGWFNTQQLVCSKGQ